MHTRTGRFLAAIIGFAIATWTAYAIHGCETDDTPPPPPLEHGCLAPTWAYIFNESDFASECRDSAQNPCTEPGLAFPKDVEVRLMLRVFDDDGRLCDPAGTTIEVSDDFALAPDGEDWLMMASYDVFDRDAMHEPSSQLIVRNGAFSKTWQAMAVVDLTGTWEITIDDLTVGDFEAAQAGRIIRWAACAPDDTRPTCSAGIVDGPNALLQSPIGGLDLGGGIAPTRDRIEGTWQNDMTASGGNVQMGLWHAIRIP